MNFIRQIFNRKIFRGRGQREPKPLRIEGVRTTMTPQPDDAELAAQALLESLAQKSQKPRKSASKREKDDARISSSEREQTRPKGKGDKSPKQGTPEYYRQLSEKIRQTRAAEARLTMRFLAYCEEQLALPKELYVGQTGEMESELYKRQSVAEREGGELLRRWQHCLAECIVRNMSAAAENTNTDYTDDTDSP